MAQPGKHGPVPVICIGNVTVGGAGKTPTALALSAMLTDLGYRPCFLTRGYGGRLAGPIRVDPGRHSAEDVGDEALLLARAAPTVVARDRPAGATLAAELRGDIILMDDGLQNPSLRKDLTFAVFDGGVGIGNGMSLPAGPLRAPLNRQWPHIHAIVMIGQGAPGDAIAEEAITRGIPMFRAAIKPDPEQAAALAGKRVLAFAGIGRPAKFFDTLRGCGAVLVATREFPDHHQFGIVQVSALIDRANRDGLRLVTTEKDAVRLAGLAQAEPRIADITALPVRLAFTEPDAIADFLRNSLSR